MSQSLRPAILELFRETFDGVAKGKKYTWYVEGKEAIFDALSSITSEKASELIPGARATIGAQANHLCYYLHLFNVHCRGEKEKGDWEGSWKKQVFSESDWQDVRDRTKSEYDEAFAWYQSFAVATDELEDDDATYLVSNLVHAAYHLGAIRALLPVVTAG